MLLRAAAALLALGPVVGLGACTGPPARQAPQELGPQRTGPGGDLLARGDELFGQGDLQEAKRAYARAISAEAPPAVYVQACAQVARMESLTDSIEAGEPWLRLAARRASKEEPLGWSRLQLCTTPFHLHTHTQTHTITHTHTPTHKHTHTQTHDIYIYIYVHICLRKLVV